MITHRTQHHAYSEYACCQPLLWHFPHHMTIVIPFKEGAIHASGLKEDLHGARRAVCTLRRNKGAISLAHIAIFTEKSFPIELHHNTVRIREPVPIPHVCTYVHTYSTQTYSTYTHLVHHTVAHIHTTHHKNMHHTRTPFTPCTPQIPQNTYPHTKACNMHTAQVPHMKK